MSKNIGMVLAFIAGAAVGVSATYKIAEQKYSNMANEEIESVVATFKNRKPADEMIKLQGETKEPDSESEIDDRFANSKDQVKNYKEEVIRIVTGKQIGRAHV